jgi:hypothetical protein
MDFRPESGPHDQILQDEFAPLKPSRQDAVLECVIRILYVIPFFG